MRKKFTRQFYCVGMAQLIKVLKLFRIKYKNEVNWKKVINELKCDLTRSQRLIIQHYFIILRFNGSETDMLLKRLILKRTLIEQRSSKQLNTVVEASGYWLTVALSLNVFPNFLIYMTKHSTLRNSSSSKTTVNMEGCRDYIGITALFYFITVGIYFIFYIIYYRLEGSDILLEFNI